MVLTRTVSEVWWEQRVTGSVFRQREKRNRTQLDKLLKDFPVNGAEKWVVGGVCKVLFSIFYLN